MRQTSARTCMETQRRCSTIRMESQKFLGCSTEVTKHLSEIEGEKTSGLKKMSEGVSRLFIWGLWSKVWIFKPFSLNGLDICIEECGSCDLINGTLRIKAIRKAFVEVLQLFHPCTSPPTTVERQSLYYVNHKHRWKGILWNESAELISSAANTEWNLPFIIVLVQNYTKHTCIL